MLVHYYVDVERSLEEVEGTLLDISGDLGVWAEAAYRRGEETRLAVGLAPGPLSKQVELDLGSPLHGTEAVTIPLTWRAVGASGLFPSMEAELVLAPMGPAVTHITFQGRYEPPLAVLGKMLDRAALHRVAEATVRNLVDRLALALADGEQPAEDGGNGSKP